MNTINRLKIVMMTLVAAMSLSVIAVPYIASAQDGGVSGGLTKLKGSSEVEDLGINATSREGIVELIGKIINYALYISGAIAVLFVIIGGYRYLTSAGNEEGAKKGRTTVVNALIGLVIIILAYIIVNVVVNFITT